MNLSQPYYIDKRSGNSRLELGGTWDFTYCDACTEAPEHLDYTYSATLPSSAYWNLNEAGVLPDPYFGENSHQYTFVDSKVWYYRKQFVLEQSVDCEKQDAYLCFDGVSYYSRVWLNGVLLGEHEGMFGGPVCNVADVLKRGSNELIVEAKAFNYDKTGDLRVWRGYVPTGWRNKISEIIPWNIARDEETTNGDFAVVGIWREVRLEIIPKMHLARPYLYTKSINGDEAEMHLELSISSDKINELLAEMSSPDWNFTFSYFGGLSGALSDNRVKITVELTDADSDEVVYSEAEDYTLYDYDKVGIQIKYPECQYYTRDIHLQGIEPWYPSGLGNPKLYKVMIRLEKDGILLDTLRFRTGIRTITQFESAGRKYRQRWDKYWFCINGKRIFLKGMNWTPIDILYKTDLKDYRWLLEQVRDCGIQLLRVWSGGGMPEEDRFYELCDEMGIMVWQDNFIANQITPKWDEKILENQVCYNLYRIRNHPSLAVHCGGNEFSPYTAGNNASMFVIQRNLEDLDPTRRFYRTTPDRGSYHCYRNMDASWIRKLFKQLPFMAESGTHCFPNFKTIRQVVPADECEKRVDITSEDFEQEFPGLYNHLTEYKRNKCLIMRSRTSRIADLKAMNLEQICEATQLAAFEYYQFLIQALRENYPNTVGVMPWAFKRNCPTVAVQLVDGFGDPVACYYAVKGSYAAKIAFAALEEILYAPGEEIDVPVRVINDSGEDFAGTAVLELYDDKLNCVKRESGSVVISADDYMKTPFTSRIQINTDWTDRHFFVRTMLFSKDKMISSFCYPLLCYSRMSDDAFRNEYRASPQECLYFEEGPFLKPQVVAANAAHLEAELLQVGKSGDRVHAKLRIRTDVPCYPVKLEVTDDKTLCYASDNHFFLGANEERELDLEIRITGDVPDQLTLKFSAWNAEACILNL